MNDSFYQDIPTPDMPSRASDFRRRARKNLQNQLGNGILVTLIKQLLPVLPLAIFIFLFLFFYFVAIFSGNGAMFAAVVLFGILLLAVGMVLISAPLGAGACRFWLNVTDGSPDAKVDNVFSVFRKGFWKSVRVLLAQTAIIFGIELVGLIVLAICSTYMTDDYNATEQGIAVFFTVITVVAMFLLTYAVALRYALSFYVLVEYPEMDVIEILHASAKLMRGNKWRYVCLMCSFLGWFLLASFCTCGFGYLFLIPYTSAAQAEFYREVSGTAATTFSGNTPFSPDDFLSNS